MERMPIKKPPRRKKQNQTLLMHQEKERCSLSSSSLSSSSESETVMSEESGRLIGQSCLSLSSALSTDSLKGELSLPDLLIQEPGEEDVFGGVSADEVTVPAQTRSTDDLFAVIHRSKRKMFGRKGVFSSSSSTSASSPSPPVTPAEPRSAPRVQRLPHSHSFKALLLKKGVHFGSVSRVSAVERLCRPYTPYASTSCTPRPLTPPCIAGRWLSSRTRLHTAPMAAILEHHDEEDQQNEEQYEEQDGDDDVFEFI
ncbi:NHS-like protein 1 [Periophthalmus magnuspinnatus]|uniref:NHS-like protein 1 n=1 Tax=Periophthalmus magnuspinnatus TaxID=409849 RepID=UPI00243650C9|nr:NHS-like protein 1 [Periophthalmus magnuspinnatus]